MSPVLKQLPASFRSDYSTVSDHPQCNAIRFPPRGSRAKDKINFLSVKRTHSHATLAIRTGFQGMTRFQENYVKPRPSGKELVPAYPLLVGVPAQK